MDKVGSATAIGEQPIKGLIDPAAGARMSVGEALTNLVFARVTDLKVRNYKDPGVEVKKCLLRISTLCPLVLWNISVFAM